MNAISSIAAADLPMLDAARSPLRLRPRRAWAAFRALIRDKEDTTYAFEIFDALPWKGLISHGCAFLQSAKGRRLRASEPSLPAMLDDHAALRRMPKGSLAHAYCDFMEAEGLTAQGLVDEFVSFRDSGRSSQGEYHDQFRWYYERLRDVHDLLHVLTGYGRDALGEQCVLAFSYSQSPGLAYLLIAYAGGIEIKREVGSGAPIFRAIREGQKLGRACPKLVEQPIAELLALPLDEARRRLNITPARHYARAHAVWQARGVDPYELISGNIAKPSAGAA